MIAEERNTGRLTALASQRIKASPKALYDALHGHLTGHHRFMLRFNLDQKYARSPCKCVNAPAPKCTPFQPEGGIPARYYSLPA